MVCQRRNSFTTRPLHPALQAEAQRIKLAERVRVLEAKRQLMAQADRLGPQALLPPLEGLSGTPLDRTEADAALQNLLDCSPVRTPRPPRR